MFGMFFETQCGSGGNVVVTQTFFNGGGGGDSSVSQVLAGLSQSPCLVHRVQ